MSKTKEIDLTTGSPFWSLLKFAIPVILGNLFQLFYTLADSVIVGKTLGANALAAVGATSIIIYFVFCFINGFTGGFGICLGQRYGARDEKGMRKSIAVSTLLSFAFTIILTLICCLLSHKFLQWMKIPSDISNEAYEYMFVILLGTGATVFYNMISNILRALGDSKTPLYFLVFSSILNIFLDILFIIPCKMGVSGAAWATILSQFFSALLSLWVGLHKFQILHLHRKDFLNLKESIILHLKTGFLLLRHPIVRLFLSSPTRQIYYYSDKYLTIVAPFYFILGLLAVYRTSIQSMQNGRAPFAACIIELIMRIAATVGLSGALGYLSVCIASPLAWFGACSLLIPCYYKMMKKTDRS